MNIKSLRCLLVIVALCAAGPGYFVLAAARPDHAAKNVRSLAIKWLVKHQDPERGSYGRHDDLQVGRTALVVWVLATCERKYQVVDGPYMSDAVDFILRHYQRDGSFGKCKSAKATRFNTAMAVCALSALKSRKKYRRHITRAMAYLGDTGNDGAALVEGGLVGVWPGKPGPVAKLMLRALLDVRMGQGGPWLGRVVKFCRELQYTADDTAADYGKCSYKNAVGFEADPVVVSAMAAKLADLVKANYKKLAVVEKRKTLQSKERK